jgi:crotonobetainyl-CoA:carnitine CoA-transferase CaiB-like acyl-CoA transferase
VEPWFWTRFCDYIGRPDWAGEQEPEPQRAQEMFAELRALFRERPRSQWLSELAGQDLPVAPINWDDDVLADAHLRERGSIVHLADVAGAPMHQLALPFKITGAPTAIDRPTRRVGEDTREILTELGYSSAAVQELVSAGVVAD